MSDPYGFYFISRVVTLQELSTGLLVIPILYCAVCPMSGLLLKSSCCSNVAKLMCLELGGMSERDDTMGLDFSRSGSCVFISFFFFLKDCVLIGCYVKGVEHCQIED